MIYLKSLLNIKENTYYVMKKPRGGNRGFVKCEHSKILMENWFSPILIQLSADLSFITAQDN